MTDPDQTGIGLLIQALALLPPALSWLALFVLAGGTSAVEEADWRRRWLLACAFWGALLVAVVELAGAWRALDRGTLLWTWSALAAGLWAAAIWRRPWRGRRQTRESLRQWSREWDCEWKVEEKVLMGIIVLLTGILLVIGLATPSTNWDSLTYHLPRVMHWLQQSSVDHYPTGNSRQLEFGPWSGYVVLTLHALTGGDRFDNAVQWFAMLTSIIAAALIVGQLWRWLRPAGRPAAAQTEANTQRPAVLFAGVFVATLPIGVVQSITTQTDYVAACWWVCLVAFSLELLAAPANGVALTGAALALGLGVLTKATVYIFAAPLAVVLGWWWLGKLDARLRFRWAAGFALGLILLNSGHGLRNYGVFGSPIGSRHIFAIERNAALSPGTVLSNLIRNLSLNTNTGIDWLSVSVNRSLVWLHRFTGRPLNDPATTYHVGSFRVPDKPVIFDSYAGSFYHLILIGVAAGLMLFPPGRQRAAWIYLGAAAGGFLLFCAYVRWSYWHTRIHLGYLASLGPLVSVVLVTRWRRWGVLAAAIVLAGFAFFCLATNKSRPLFERRFMTAPRELQYLYVYQPLGYEAVLEGMRDLARSGCLEAGLHLGFDDAEYPLWVFLRNRGFEGRLRHVRVTNESAFLNGSNAPLCAVISTVEDQVLREIYPFETRYGELTIHWSAPASRWSELAWYNLKTYEPEELSRRPALLEFNRRLIILYFRVPRPGQLQLRGQVESARGGKENQLRVATDRGFESFLAQSNRTFSVRVPIQAGTTALKLSLVQPLAANEPAPRLRLEGWQWAPSEGAAQARE